MLQEEKGHFTTPVFLAMDGHDISSPYPLESKVIKDAKEIFDGKYEIIHTDLDHFWQEAEKYLDRDKMVHLKGERRSYLKEGKWTYLLPSTISARSYMKQIDFKAYTQLTYVAEPLSRMADTLCSDIKHNVYLDRAWKYLLSNHTHDANGGGAVDDVCADMRYRLGKVCDISTVLTEDSTANIVKNLSSDGDSNDTVRLTVFNTLPFARDIITDLELLLPDGYEEFEIDGAEVKIKSHEKDSTFVDSIWEVPTILDVNKFKATVLIKQVPALGYKSLKIKKSAAANRDTLKNIAGGNILENDYIKVEVNQNGTADITVKNTGKCYKGVNYLTSQGETGNAWSHKAPEDDKIINSNDCNAKINITENGDIRASITAEYDFYVPKDCNKTLNEQKTAIPVKVTYTLCRNSSDVSVKTELNNTAKDHWLRVNFPTEINTDVSYSDSHYDVVKRNIAVPDSTGWVETAYGMQPLRTFAALTDGKDGFAVMPKGLYEYEVYEDGHNTLALTLIRACRIRLQVSEEKITELPDNEIQCMGERVYEYKLHFFKDDISVLPNVAAEYFTDAPCIVSGKGNGNLPLSYSMFKIDNPSLHVTAIKKAENGDGMVIRLYNPSEKEQTANIVLDEKYKEIYRCRMDEKIIAKSSANICVGTKKIFSLLIK